jgi:hypothetical protein
MTDGRTVLESIWNIRDYVWAIFGVSSGYLWDKGCVYLGNYIRDDTDFILKDNFRQFRHQLLSISFYPKIVKNYRKLGKIFFRNKNTLRYKNYNKSIVIFWFAQKGNSLPGEQNKIYINNNDDNLIQQLATESTPSVATI